VTTMSAPLLRVTGLVKHYAVKGAVVRAVDGVDLTIKPGETLGLVGESGCGKSTLGKLILRLLAPDAGTIEFEGIDLAPLTQRQLRRYRPGMQMIFQDPYASLHPRMTVGRMLEEPLIVHRRGDAGERRERVRWLMDRVGLRPDAAARYPHEFSGGQRQRIGVARALALKPKLVIADEPVSALDVSIQAQVLNLLRDMQRQLGLTLVFIAHDLSVVRHMCDRVAVMYLGRVVEIGSSDALYEFPRHPYTGALLSSVPVADPAAKRDERHLLSGDVPSPANPPKACRFHTRCPKAQELCSIEDPPLQDKGTGTRAACHFPLSSEEVAQIGVRSAR
jgi:peptide/nickel transport system ATP-binding protein